MSAERWLPIPGYEDRYEVSDHGRVRSLRRGVVLRLRDNNRGYSVALLRRGRNHLWYPTVHKLVMLAFVGPRPEGLVVRHLNGVKTDCRLSNLKYGTYSENELDKKRLGELAPPVTHCHNNHEFDDENTYLRPGGVGRSCRKCHQAAQARYLARRAVAA